MKADADSDGEFEIYTDKENKTPIADDLTQAISNINGASINTKNPGSIYYTTNDINVFADQEIVGKDGTKYFAKTKGKVIDKEGTMNTFEFQIYADTTVIPNPETAILNLEAADNIIELPLTNSK